MTKTIRLKTNESGESYIDIAELADMLDITQVDTYTQSEQDGGIVIKFFDKDGNLIEPKHESV